MYYSCMQYLVLTGSYYETIAMVNQLIFERHYFEFLFKAS